MRKKLSFIAAILHRPKALLCDEALEGFDVGAALEAKRELVTLARAGATVLFSSHVTETIERLCDRVVILHRGRVARTLERATWGAEPRGPSPLEQEFLAVASLNPLEESPNEAHDARRRDRASIPLVARADRPSPPIQSLLLESATPAEQRSRLLAHARKVASTDRLVAGEAYQLRGQSFERAGMRDSAIASFRLATVLRGRTPIG